MKKINLDLVIPLIKKIYRNKKIIPLHVPIFSGNEKKYVSHAIDSTFVSTAGKNVELFEKKICKITNSKYAIATSSGTSAIHIALLVAGCEPNTHVITQSMSFVATSNAINYCNAEPIFVDIDHDTLGMSPKSLVDFLKNNCEIKKDGFCWNIKTKKKISACLPMHTYGFPLRIDEISKICKKYNISLIEDCAESLGSFYKKKHTGKFGRIGAISFNGNKIITTGGGGIIITDEKKLAIKARHLSTTSKIPHKWNFDHDNIGYNYRMPNLNASLGLAQLEQLKIFLINKKKIYSKYKKFLTKYNFQLLSPIKNAEPNYWLNILILKNRHERDKFLKISHKDKIYCRPTWKLLHTLKMFRNCQKDNLINSKNLEKKIICLPSSVVK